MSWKTIIINKYDKLSLKNNLLKIENTKQESDKSLTFSLSDINCVILENNYTLISTQLISKLLDNNVFLVVCNDSYEPNGIMLSYHNHWKPLAIIEKQISINSEYKKIIWKQIIEKKIENSLNVMVMIGCSDRSIEMVSNFQKTVKLNDTTNREGLAAKVFFRELYGSNFIRFSDDIINKTLNYGYTILASAISRTLVKYGLLCFLGIFHIGKTNNWNLSYDLLEPFRPLVDLWVIKNLDGLEGENISYNKRLELINLLNQFVSVDGKFQTITNAIDIMVRSYVTVLKTTSSLKLKLPTIIYYEEKVDDIYEYE
ncbi:type II CRISPR-associated endonuclease Cas1 [Spiroplasma apis]|uniref:CRISPR-associated endonuclease Cas1 n=1 Tax=Spiroplasma apis B31 TaxID=1276258 RepID=V5RI93_SPIAP|nr:type II CRISPR-associated endonuclease Cas1 [Spiroplasma apis]AHB36274.1 CRISPR-associated protein Cas1 [Spiroplasma apis B31]